MQVTVDDDFARFGAKSYAINKINTVEVREREPHNRGWAILFAIVAALVFIGAAGQIGQKDSQPGGSVVLAIVLAGLAYWQWQRSKIREYSLFLMTSSSEAQAFITRDQREVLDLRERIESAIIRSA